MRNESTEIVMTIDYPSWLAITKDLPKSRVRTMLDINDILLLGWIKPKPLNRWIMCRLSEPLDEG